MGDDLQQDFEELLRKRAARRLKSKEIHELPELRAGSGGAD
jgi:hypothetical protein